MSCGYKEYRKLYIRHKEEYGDKIVVLYQCGSFYEVYTSQENGKIIGNAEEISKVLDMKLAKKDSKFEFSETNPYMLGFPLNSLNKYIAKLINHDNQYKVIVYNQKLEDKTITRELFQIYTSAILPLDFDEESNTENNNYLLIGVLSQTKNDNLFNYGFSLFNNTTNKIKLSQDICNLTVKEIAQEKELIKIKYNVSEYYELFSTELQDKYTKKEYQDEILNSVYIDTNLNTEALIDVSTKISFCYLLDLIYKYNPKLLINISYPEILNNENNLILHLNSINQLHLKELVKCIDNTQTIIGRRKLKQLIMEPYSSTDEINYSLSLSKEIGKDYKLIKVELQEIKDVVKLHRELTSFYISFERIHLLKNNYISLLNILNNLDSKSILKNRKEIQYNLQKMILDINTNLEYQDRDQGQSQGFKETSIWKTEKLKKLEQERDQLTLKNQSTIDKYKEFDKNEHLKLEREGKGSYYYKITSIRYNANLELKKAIEKDNLIVIKQKSAYKIVSNELNKESYILQEKNDEIDEERNNILVNYLTYFINEFSGIFNAIKESIEILDISVMNNINFEKNKYKSPLFTTATTATTATTLDIKNVRHPIIERIKNDTKYIENDIEFSNEKSGIVLYGINSSGKSSLIRAIGVNIIMAQCGLFTPSDYICNKPYKNIICQVDFHDDIFKGQSSFVTEAMGIIYMRKILQKKEHTMIIADELTRGTEHISAIAIFGSTLLEMLEGFSCHFIFTTHIHEIVEISLLKKYIQVEKLRIYHLSISLEGKESKIVFNRKLTKGEITNKLYGLEIVNSMIGNNVIFDSFTLNSEEIRKEICGERNSLIQEKKSRYNSKKVVNKCEICSYTVCKKTDLPLDTHHIEFQCTADSKGFIDNFHKNKKFNLVVLCKSCHVKVHEDKINIYGYKDSPSGKFLSFEKK